MLCISRPVSAIGMAPRLIRRWGISRLPPSVVKPSGVKLRAVDHPPIAAGAARSARTVGRNLRRNLHAITYRIGVDARVLETTGPWHLDRVSYAEAGLRLVQRAAPDLIDLPLRAQTTPCDDFAAQLRRQLAGRLR